jgi:hypothetical protein
LVFVLFFVVKKYYQKTEATFYTQSNQRKAVKKILKIKMGENEKLSKGP